MIFIMYVGLHRSLKEQKRNEQYKFLFQLGVFELSHYEIRNQMIKVHQHLFENVLLNPSSVDRRPDWTHIPPSYENLFFRPLTTDGPEERLYVLCLEDRLFCYYKWSSV